jgi:hypothetical protein
VPKGSEAIAVEAYLHGRVPAHQQTAYGMDSSEVKQSTGAAFIADQLK